MSMRNDILIHPSLPGRGLVVAQSKSHISTVVGETLCPTRLGTSHSKAQLPDSAVRLDTSFPRRMNPP
jgi:hypothetical protein